MTARARVFSPDRPARVVVIGAGGYSGAELVGLLLTHPAARPVGLFASARREKGDQPGAFEDLFPRFAGQIGLEVLPTDVDAVAALEPDAVFLATPHQASAELVPALADRLPLVLDLSGAYRLKDRDACRRHYGLEHARRDLVEAAVYGLPELPGTRRALSAARLVSVPGCYPTSAILPLAPLARAGAIRPGTRPIIDATSGVSGAGRGLALKTLFCEVSLQPYNVLAHRHNPEIDACVGLPTLFTPHLACFDRGILSTIHVELAEGWDAPRVERTLRSAYGREPFVRLLGTGRWPSVAGVERTNFCDIAWAVDEAGRHLILFSAIDNLVKGAAGQALQCMNLALGLPETAGLPPARSIEDVT
jgi:N-acetyl-gamma-glutamyl-phosphate reductase